MIKKYLILLLYITNFLLGDFIPEDNSSINYTQVFFKWPQIENAESYVLDIQNSFLDTFQINSIFNSIIVKDFIDWNHEYNWEVCGIDSLNNTVLCHDIYSFTTNPLPAYYPDNIEVLLSSDSYYPGITILDFDANGFSAAIDKEGNPIWFVDKNLFGDFNPKILVTQLLNSGNFIGIGVGSGYEFDINGTIIFETPSMYGTHHHFIKKDSTYFLIDANNELHPCPDGCPDNLPENIYWKGDQFIQLDSSGELIWEWNSFDYINLSEYNPYYLERFSNSYPEEQAMDWTHSNSVFYDIDSQSLIVSIRNLSRIIKINYNSGSIIWELGDTNFMDEIYFNNEIEFSQQHSVKKIDNGNILFFDNHSLLEPEISKCIEIEYSELTDSVGVVWEYILPYNLFTGSRGECSRLNNENTLINVGRTGNILEVNNNNELVWHLRMIDDNLDAASYRASRVNNLYPLAFSFIIDNLKGSYLNQDYYIYNTDLIEFTLYNIGWSEQKYDFFILNTQYEEIYTDSIIIDPSNLEPIQIDISQLNINDGEDYILKVSPNIKPDLFQETHFSIVNSYIGDFNNDNIINILDVIIIVNAIMGNSSNSLYDLNNDQILNILDIIILINIILDD